MNDITDPREPQLRLPPFSLEAEQAVLGAVLLDASVLDRIRELVSEPDFYRQEHRRIFAAVRTSIDAGRPADIVTVAEVMRGDGNGCDLAYLASLVQFTPSFSMARSYAQIVRERSLQRQLAGICTEVIDGILQPGEHDINAELERAESKMFSLRQNKGSGGKTIGALLVPVLERVDHLYHAASDKTPGLETGFVDLDQMIDGMEAGDLIVIAGRPRIGKTALAMNIAEHVVMGDVPVMVFSLEMSDQSLAQRMLGSNARIDQHRLKRGRLTDDEWVRLSSSVGRLHDRPLTIEETSGLSIGDLRARARRGYRQSGGALGLIVIDYLQLMVAQGETRAQAIGEISRGLKALAKELKIPIIALSQLNRGLEMRQNKRPILSDLRESGDLEQDPDKILFVYRDEEYNKDSQHAGIAEVIVGKNRNGPSGTVYLTWIGEFTRFENYTGQVPSAAVHPIRRKSQLFDPRPDQ